MNVHNENCSQVSWVASRSDTPTLLPIGGMDLVCISHLGAENQVRSVTRLREWDFDLIVTEES